MSEFFQMFVYVVLTVFLFQKGSSESKDPGEASEVDRDPRLSAGNRNAPGPVRQGCWRLRLYENSLSITFLLPAAGGVHEFNAERALHGAAAISFAIPRALALLVRIVAELTKRISGDRVDRVFSIFLRQRGSPESRPC